MCRYLFQSYSDDIYQPTIEDIYSHTLEQDEDRVELQILDTAGLDDFKGLVRDAKVRECSAYIVVIDLTSQSSI